MDRNRDDDFYGENYGGQIPDFSSFMSATQPQFQQRAMQQPTQPMNQGDDNFWGRVGSAVAGVAGRVAENPVVRGAMGVLDKWEDIYMTPVVAATRAVRGDFEGAGQALKTWDYTPGDLTGNEWGDLAFQMILDPLNFILPGAGAARAGARAGIAAGTRVERASRAVEMATKSSAQIAKQFGKETADEVLAFARLAETAAQSGTLPSGAASGVPDALLGLPRFNYYRREVDALIAAGNDPATWRLSPTENPMIAREMTFSSPQDVPKEIKRWTASGLADREAALAKAVERLENPEGLSKAQLNRARKTVDEKYAPIELPMADSVSSTPGLKGVEMSPGWSREYDDAMSTIRKNQNRIEEWYKAGAESPNAYWYSQQEVLDSIIDAVAGGGQWTDEIIRDGRAVFMMLNDIQAMASPGSTPPTQLRRAMYVFEEMLKGTPIKNIKNAPSADVRLARYREMASEPVSRIPSDFDQSVLRMPDELPLGMGSNKWEGQSASMQRIQENLPGDPRSWADPEQVFGKGSWKTSGYSRALSGNLGDIVADMHYGRALMHTDEHIEHYRRFADIRRTWDEAYNAELLRTGKASKAEEAAIRVMPENEFTLREVTDNVTNETTFKKGRPKYVGGVNEIADPGASATYAAQRDFGFEMAAKYGVDPGEFQARVWVGAADFTGVVDPTAFGQLMWQRLAALGAQSGTDATGAFRQLLEGQLHISSVVPSPILMDMLIRAQLRLARAYASNEIDDDGEDLEGVSPELAALVQNNFG